MKGNQIDFLVKQRDALSMAVEAANEYLESMAPAEAEGESQVYLPGPETLKGLPWKSYKTREAAAPDEAAWIFTNASGAESLLATLKTKDRTRIAGFEYQLQKDDKFMARKPVKK